jgi:transposase-like protein
MKGTYRKKDRRSRRGKRVYRAEFVPAGADGPDRSVRIDLPVGELLGDLRAAVNDFAGESGLRLMLALIGEEVEQRAGRRYEHNPERDAHRWGWEDGYVTWAGRKVPIERPRLRDRKGREVELERYGQFQSDGAMQQDVARRVLAGVSSRKYERVLDELCDGYGISKSSVSRQWRAASAEALRGLCERLLGELDFAALMIDGIRFGEFLLIVALGIDAGGHKHVLGLWQGDTENATVVGGLLDDLIGRGLSTEKKYLFVLDGAKSLAKAVRAKFGVEVLIQRCTVHKRRNVLGHLPPRYHWRFAGRLKAAWSMKDYAAAKRELEAWVKELAELNPSAAASLEEGLEETLTLHRLGVPETLRVSLRSTNLIESSFSTTRQTSQRVKRWRTADQAWRWAGSSLVEAEKRFKRVKGFFGAMSVLRVALDRVVDSSKAVG